MSKMVLAVSLGLLVLSPVLSYAAPKKKNAHMTAQIQRLLNEKQEKMSKLEECEGKRTGFMVAGISTIGLTAVGIGVNVAQANKSNKLSEQIEDQNRELAKQQTELANVNSQISDKEQERSNCESDATKIWVGGRCLDRARYECDQDPNKEWKDGQCVDKPIEQPEGPQDDHQGGDDAVEPDGIIGQPCTGNGDGAIWVAEDGGDKKCLSAEGATDIVACSCKVPGENPVDPNNPIDPNNPVDPNNPTNPNGPTNPNNPPSESQARIVGQPCKAEDMPEHATSGVYTQGGELDCVASEGASDTIKCSCKITACDTDGGFVLNNTKGTCDPETTFQKCLRERKGNKEGTACCYIPLSEAEWKNGSCKCIGTGKKFSIASNGHGQCIEEIPEKCVGKGKKVGDEVPEGCKCDNGLTVNEWGRCECKGGHLFGDLCVKDCKDGFVRIRGGGMDCVKWDYQVAHGYLYASCKCANGESDCGLRQDPNGKSVCQTGRSEGERCSCVKKCVIDTFGKEVPDGCECDFQRGLFKSTVLGKTMCGCQKGDYEWNSTQLKCQKKEKEPCLIKEWGHAVTDGCECDSSLGLANKGGTCYCEGTWSKWDWTAKKCGPNNPEVGNYVRGGRM